MFDIRTIVLEIGYFVKMVDASRSGEFVTSLARGLQVVRAFDVDHPVMTLSEVAKRTGLTRAAARRFLHTLRELGYVSSDGRDFRLTPHVLSLGYAYLSSMSIVEIAQPYIEDISKQVSESCSMSVLDGFDIVYVARVPAKRIMSVALSVGTRLPAHNTSMGRVLLASMDEEELDNALQADDNVEAPAAESDAGSSPVEKKGFFKKFSTIFFSTSPFLANNPKLSNFLFELCITQSSIKEQQGPASNAKILFKLVLDL